MRVNIDVKAAGRHRAAGPGHPRARRDSTGSASGRSPTVGCGRSAPCWDRGSPRPQARPRWGRCGFAPARLASWLRSPAPVLQVPTGHVLGGRRLDLVTPALWSASTRLGKHVHVWTIDDAAEMHRLFDLGVDGIVSDRIDTLAEVLAERGVPLGQ